MVSVRTPGDGYAARGGGGDIDVVIADRHICHDAQLRARSVQEFRVDAFGEDGENRVHAAHGHEEFLARHGAFAGIGVNVVYAEGIVEQGGRDAGELAGHVDAHGPR